MFIDFPGFSYSYKRQDILVYYGWHNFLSSLGPKLCKKKKSLTRSKS